MPVYEFSQWLPQIAADCWIAPGAHVMGRVWLAEGVGIWFGAVVRGDEDEIRIGRSTNIQDGSVLHVDEGFPLHVGERVTVGHGAILHGCTVEDGVLVGMGATVLNGARVGEYSIIAANALVREGEQIPPFSLVAGLPAKVKTTLPEEETRRSHAAWAEKYAERARLYRRQLGVRNYD